MNQFMGVLTDPFIDGRGDVAAPSGSAAGYADERGALAYAAKGATGRKSERDAYATMAPAQAPGGRRLHQALERVGGGL